QPPTGRRPRRPRSSRQHDRPRLPAAHSPTVLRRAPPAPHPCIVAIRDMARTWTATTTASVASRIGGGSVARTVGVTHPAARPVVTTTGHGDSRHCCDVRRPSTLGVNDNAGDVHANRNFHPATVAAARDVRTDRGGPGHDD